MIGFSLIFSDWLISMQIVGLLHAPMCLTNKDAELNSQFPFCNDLNQILPNMLKIEKAEKHDIQLSQNT